MTTETEALRRAFETYINPDADVNLHWLAAGYYAGRGVQQSWLDFQAGHAAALSAVPANVGEPYTYCYEWHVPFGITRRLDPAPHDGLQCDATVPLYTAAQLAAAVAQEREQCAKMCEAIEHRHWKAYKSRPESSNYQHTEGLSDGAGECASAIRAGEAKEANDG